MTISRNADGNRMARRNVCPLPLSLRSRLARDAADQIMSRQMPSATNRTACAAFMPKGRTKVWVNSGRVARNGPTRTARTMTMKYGPIQPQDVVMCRNGASLCLSVTEGLSLSTKRGNHAATAQIGLCPDQGRRGAGGAARRYYDEVAAFLSGSSSFSETLSWPRPIPTSISGLVTP